MPLDQRPRNEPHPAEQREALSGLVALAPNPLDLFPVWLLAVQENDGGLSPPPLSGLVGLPTNTRAAA
jgi:hypothetical protein